MNIQDFDYKYLLYSPLFSKILTAIITLLIGLTLGRAVGKIIHRVLKEFSLNKTVKKEAKIKISIEKGISDFTEYLIYFVTIIIVLSQLGLPITTHNMMIIPLAIFVIAIFFIINHFWQKKS